MVTVRVKFRDRVRVRVRDMVSFRVKFRDRSRVTVRNRIRVRVRDRFRIRFRTGLDLERVKDMVSNRFWVGLCLGSGLGWELGLGLRSWTVLGLELGSG